jgi:hypothetical protein
MDSVSDDVDGAKLAISIGHTEVVDVSRYGTHEDITRLGDEVEPLVGISHSISLARGSKASSAEIIDAASSPVRPDRRQQ